MEKNLAGPYGMAFHKVDTRSRLLRSYNRILKFRIQQSGTFEMIECRTFRKWYFTSREDKIR